MNISLNICKPQQKYFQLRTSIFEIIVIVTGSTPQYSETIPDGITVPVILSEQRLNTIENIRFTCNIHFAHVSHSYISLK